MRLTFITIIAALALSSCGGNSKSSEVSSLISKRDSLKTLRSELTAQISELEKLISSNDSSGNQRITTVTTLPVERTRFEHFFTIQGVVETDQNAQIFPEVGGRITSIRVKEGDQVTKGQVLMTIDDRVIKNQIEELESRLNLAETVYKKQEQLWNQQVGSEIQFLEAKNNYESLKQNVETLKSQRSLFSITAPFSGIVDEITPKEGEMAAPQMPAFRLINNNSMYIKADVTERYLGQIKEGDAVNVAFPSLGITESSKIIRIGDFINPNNRTFKIKVGLENNNTKMKPNLLGELMIRDYVSDSAVVIPSSLVQLNPSGEAFVYLLEDGFAKKIKIETGMSYNDRIEILSGLSGSEILIDKGARSIKEGDQVKVEAELE
jgi:RND family efflux transporter MFP subunit